MTDKKIEQEMCEEENTYFVIKERKKYGFNGIRKPFYEGNEKCEYCEGTNDTSHTVFEVKLKMGATVKACPCCVGEQFFGYPEEIIEIKNIGEWK